MTDNRRQWAATTYSLGSPIPDGLQRVGVVSGQQSTPSGILPVELNYGTPLPWQKPVAAIPVAAPYPSNLLLVADYAFTPARLSGLAGWWDASDPATLFQDSGLTTPAVADSDPVGGWKDKSGNGKDGTQATAANRPLLKLNVQNGRPALRFDATNDDLAIALAQLADFTILAVCSSVNPGAVPVVLGNSNATTFVRLEGPGGQTGARGDASTLVAMTGGDPISTAKNQHTWDTGGSVMSWYQGGVFRAASTTITDAFTFNRIGSRGTGFFNGDMCELLVFNRVLSAAERAQIEQYLIGKWGL